MAFTAEKHEKSFKGDGMTPEKIASLFNEVEREFENVNRRLDELPSKIMNDVKIWVMGGIIATMITGIIVPVVISVIIHYINK